MLLEAFLFWNYFRLIGSCKHSTESFPIPLTQFPPLLASDVTLVYLPKLKIITLVHHYLYGTVNYRLYSDFTHFSTCVCPLSQNPVQETSSHLIAMPPLSPLLWDSFSVLLCLPWPWWFWRILVRCVRECSSIWGLSEFFSWWDGGWAFRGRKPQRWCAFDITSSQGVTTIHRSRH